MKQLLFWDITNTRTKKYWFNYYISCSFFAKEFHRDMYTKPLRVLQQTFLQWNLSDITYKWMENILYKVKF